MFLRLVHLCFSCRWINVKFKQRHRTCLALLREMITGLTGSLTKAILCQTIRYRVHRSDTGRGLSVIGRVRLNKDKLDTLLHMLDLQSNGLHSRLDHKVKKKKKKIALILQRLRNLTKNDKVENEAWERIRKELLKLFGLLNFLPAVSVNNAAKDSQ